MGGLVMNPEFWNNKRVLVTGHTGFKGCWLSLWLHRMRASVTGFALDPPTIPSLYAETHLNRAIVSVHGDVRNAPHLLEVIQSHRPEIIFHLAAQPLVSRSYHDPIETYATNVMGTVHLLDAVRKSDSVRVVVNVTSDKCYENAEWVWGYRETDPMGGYDPYSSSKGCAELVTAAFRRSFFSSEQTATAIAAIASARAGNVIGGGDWAENRLVPDLIRGFLDRQTVTIRRPDAVRPWQHVLEPLSGYLLLAEHLWREPQRYAQGWNFGPLETDARPVHAIVEEVARIWGAGANWSVDRTGAFHEAGQLKLDCSKARAQLGWTPTWTLSEALAHTVEWFQAHAAGTSATELCYRQFQQFEAAQCGNSRTLTVAAT